MPLYEFMLAHREEIVAACKAELEHTDSPSPLARYVARSFDEALQSLKHGASADFDCAEREKEKKEAEPLTVGQSAVMAQVRNAVAQMARRSRVPVLISGEFGVGKRHAARALHLSTYPEGEFFELDGPARLHELERRRTSLRVQRGTQSFGLTVFVHELCDVPASVQLALSRLLGEQAFPMRIVVSSSRALSHAARDGLVRTDLAFSFPATIQLPPLRDRLEDIPELARHFAELAAARTGAPVTRFSAGAIERLQEHSWPGNVAELQKMIWHLTDEFGPAIVEADDIPESDARKSGVSFRLPVGGIDFAELERELIAQALKMASNNQTRAARLLGLTRDQLRYRLAKFEIASGATRQN
ncbi:MAG TPA: helix-turn-helix domain-containing protein [Polyangiaceae bacterium]|jgi:DNA-binding NtrC family response regulator|nr:helix-turn-helix domain-containing protein [Polyangiaceae bacterium]